MALVLEDCAGLLHYEPSTGKLYFKTKDGITRRMATIERNGKAATLVNIFGQDYVAARLVWLMHNGSYPDGKLMRLDGDVTNDRLGNLRLAATGLGKEALNRLLEAEGHVRVIRKRKTGFWYGGLRKGGIIRYVASGLSRQEIEKALDKAQGLDLV